MIMPPNRILLGPGPSMTHPRVLQALAAPTIGHLDPELLRLYTDEQDLLRRVFQPFPCPAPAHQGWRPRLQI
jgi:alanine-glyoxylate transaminase/serine-glyoxylate transaminase/serine-pyruvate transaminase